jgi:DNA-binding transcriptional ArsR family regulator
MASYCPTSRAEVFGVLANEARLDIIFSLLDREKNVSELQKELGLDQSLVSHALKRLEVSGFVSVRNEGKFRFFKLNKEFAGPFISALDPSRDSDHRGNLFRLILAEAPITITILDKDGVFTFVYGDILRKYGAVEEDFVGKPFVDFYRSRQDVVANIKRALSGEKVHWTSESAGHVFDTVSMPYRDDRGNIAGVLNVSYELPNTPPRHDA